MYNVLFPLSCFSCSYVILIACFIDYLISPFPPSPSPPCSGGPPSCSFTLPTNFPAFVHIVQLELFPCLLPTSHIYNFLRMGNKSLILKKLQSLLSDRSFEALHLLVYQGPKDCTNIFSVVGLDMRNDTTKMWLWFTFETAKTSLGLWSSGHNSRFQGYIPTPNLSSH